MQNFTNKLVLLSKILDSRVELSHVWHHTSKVTQMFLILSILENLYTLTAWHGYLQLLLEWLLVN